MPVDRAREAGAEQRIDDERGALEARRPTAPRPAPSSGAAAAAASPFSAAALAEQREPHRPAALRQDARRDEAVAAIVAGTAQHADRPRAASAAMIASATARPAFSISAMPGMPPAIVSRSASPISCGVKSAWRRQASEASLIGAQVGSRRDSLTGERCYRRPAPHIYG